MLGLFTPIPGKRPEALDRLQIATDRALGVVAPLAPPASAYVSGSRGPPF